MEGDLHMLKGPNGYYYVAREGKQGLPGKDGLDGRNTYIAYASSAAGADISLTPSSGLTYIAIVQSDTHYGSETEILGLFEDAVWLQYLGQVTTEQLNTALAGKANVSHTHDWDEIFWDVDNEISLPEAWNDAWEIQQGQDNFLLEFIENNESSIAALSAALSGKAADSHTHAQSDITGLASTLAGKQNVLPAGTAGQFLKKTANGVEWADAPQGTQGGGSSDGDMLSNTDVVSPLPADNGDLSALWNNNEGVRGKTKLFIVGPDNEEWASSLGHILAAVFFDEPVLENQVASFPTVSDNPTYENGTWEVVTYGTILVSNLDPGMVVPDGLYGDYYYYDDLEYWVRSNGAYAVVHTPDGVASSPSNEVEGWWFVPIAYAEKVKTSHSRNDWGGNVGVGPFTALPLTEHTRYLWQPAEGSDVSYRYIFGASGCTNCVIGTLIDITACICGSANNNFVLKSEVGAANGVAGLDSSGVVPSAQLPIVSNSYGKLGLVQIASGYGFSVFPNTLAIAKATDAQLSARTNNYTPIVPSNLNPAVTAALTDANHITLAAKEQATARAVLGISSAITTIPAATSAYSLLDATATTNNYSWHYVHEPTSAPTYTLPAVTDATVAHQIDLKVKFSSGVLTYSFLDSEGSAVTPLTQPEIAAGTVVDFFCEYDPLVLQWVITPKVHSGNSSNGGSASSGGYIVSGASNSAANGTYNPDASHTGRHNSPVWSNGTYYMTHGWDGDMDDAGWAITTTIPNGVNSYNQTPQYWVVSYDESAPPTSGWSNGVTVSAS